MKKIILLYNVQDREEMLKIRKALLPLKLQVRQVKKEDYNRKIGLLAGMKELKEDGGTYMGEELEESMLVMAGLTDRELDQVLKALRTGGVRQIPYKAVLTQTNCQWNAFLLYEELKAEHEAMKNKQLRKNTLA